jgi:hypothetical protein
MSHLSAANDAFDQATDGLVGNFGIASGSLTQGCAESHIYAARAARDRVGLR